MAIKQSSPSLLTTLSTFMGLPPAGLDDVRPGGLGTHFINEIMDEVRFLVPPGGRGNRLEMVKRIA